MSNSPRILPKINLGKNGPLVGVQGLGCMGMVTDYYGPTDEKESLATLGRALERGVTLFDTADAYGYGKNEEFIAPFVRANRDRVFLATKFGIVRASDTFATPFGIENKPEYIHQAVDASLRRLGIEVIDLYYMHRRNPEVPLADSVGAMADLVTAGKVRFLGLSEVTAEELREAHAIHPVTALQTEWSLFSREVEKSIVPTAAELGIGFVPYSPLGRGQLTGQVSSDQLGEKDVRHLFSRFKESENSQLVTALKTIADERAATPAQIALAWLYQQATVYSLAIVPIPGTRKPSRVDENVDGALLTLSSGELAALEPLASAVKGSRDMVMPGKQD